MASLKKTFVNSGTNDFSEHTTTTTTSEGTSSGRSQATLTSMLAHYPQLHRCAEQMIRSLCRSTNWSESDSSSSTAIFQHIAGLIVAVTPQMASSFQSRSDADIIHLFCLSFLGDDEDDLTKKHNHLQTAPPAAEQKPSTAKPSSSTSSIREVIINLSDVVMSTLNFATRHLLAEMADITLHDFRLSLGQYTTKGAVLRALLLYLIGRPETPDDVKMMMGNLLEYVRNDEPFLLL